MSILFNDGRSRHYGDYDDGSLRGSRPDKSEQLGELVEKLVSASKVVPGTSSKVNSSVLDTTVKVGSSEYSVRVKSDGTFTAERADGEVEIKLIHDARSRGQLKLIYVNNSDPDQAGETYDAAVTKPAESLGQKWYKAATKKGSLDI